MGLYEVELFRNIAGGVVDLGREDMFVNYLNGM